MAALTGSIMARKRIVDSAARSATLTLMRDPDPRWFTGKLLLAMPGIGDPRFEQSVIAIVSHDEEGAMGIGCSAESAMRFAELLEQSGVEPRVATPEAPILIGGPVETTRGFIVHSLDWSGQGSIDVAGRFGLTITLDVLRALAAGKGPSRWFAALGYAGWGEGQLEEEVANGGWHVTDCDDAALFDLSPETRWASVFVRDGIDPLRLASVGGRA